MNRADESLTSMVEGALLKASEEVRRKARETGTPILVWEGGRIVRIFPETLEEIEPAGVAVGTGSDAPGNPALPPSDEQECPSPPGDPRP